ncbi:PefC/AfrB family outer membrane usher protein [Providencia sp. JGM181]|uniref:PefC/AfrB family outer membrane usher protein n=1 Tax=unclassified Providencia TaxID=2633465 RepID=UPI001BA916B2|nr:MULTISPECIES: PefC/AfrB family outer membrane usher protein [unclassified Providencia]MBS0925391.1 PefC/AfrB family outer membrane usher protein [Providencia sp. JGM181]MBS0934034.1 PefC/AfrB family outer membrane usher protein [Providencia sp. JGM172]MBS0998283.1 PefC/AfrB family outer membrane usher protein [Providencia sp. JGM178]
MRLKPVNAFILSLLVSPFCVYANLNMDFLHGGVQSQAASIFDDSVKYPEGHYIVEVIFNRHPMGKKELIILTKDRENLCLNTTWINELSLPINLSLFENEFDAERNCYNLGHYPGVKIDFDNAKQVLTFNIPQVALDNSKNQQEWDYGIPGIKVNYSGYVSKTTSANTQLYGDFDLYSNFGRWVGYVRSSYLKDSGTETSEATISTAMKSIQGSFIAGKTITSMTMLPNFVFYGMALRSEKNMRPWEMRGYAPVISGVVSSNAKITISQNGYVLSSQVVPAGAYQLNDISPVSNGDLTITVEEDNGTKTVRYVPVATLPSLLRANEMDYNLVIGERELAGKRESHPFLLGALDYGFTYFTLQTAGILHSDYQSAGIGLSKEFGQFGAVSFNVNAANSHFQKQTPTSPDAKQSGISYMLKYANSLSNTTNLQLLTYRYTGKEYVDFNEFNQNALYQRSNRKERYETIISQNFDNSFISLSGWVQTYRNRIRNEIGANVTYNTAFKGIDFSVSADYQKLNDHDRDNYAISIGVNIPFSVFDKNHFWTNSVSYDRDNKASFNSGIAGNINEKVNYSVNTSKDRDSWSNSAYFGFNQDWVNTGVAIAQNQHQTTGSINASGSLLATQQTGLFLTNVRQDTVAIANIKNIGNIVFNDSPPTDRHGNTVIGVSPYIENNLKINTEEVPNNVELLDSVQRVVPTDKAIVYREFKYSTIHRYILRLKKKNGEFVSAGSSARTENNDYVGFVSNGGVLLLNLLSQPNAIFITSSNDEVCTLNMNGVEPNENQIMEIECND